MDTWDVAVTQRGKVAWYCSSDGGQWNVRVEIVCECGSVILIRGKDLRGTAQQSQPHEDGYNYLVVSSYEVSDLPE